MKTKEMGKGRNNKEVKSQTEQEPELYIYIYIHIHMAAYHVWPMLVNKPIQYLSVYRGQNR